MPRYLQSLAFRAYRSTGRGLNGRGLPELTPMYTYERPENPIYADPKSVETKCLHDKDRSILGSIREIPNQKQTLSFQGTSNDALGACAM